MYQNRFPFKIDMILSSRPPLFEVVQNDSDINYLQITITSLNKPINLTDYIVNIRFEKPDGNTVEDSANILDVNSGLIEYKLGTNEIAILGIVKGIVVLYGKNGERGTSVGYFKLSIIKDGKVNFDVPSTTEYPILADLIRQNQSLLNSEDIRQNTFNTNEQSRQTNETQRQTNEATRQSQESDRVSAEQVRVLAESARQINETARQNLKTAMDALKTNIETDESTRQSNETTRQNQETTRVNQESQRLVEFEGIKNNMDVTSSKPLDVVRNQQVVNPMSSYNYVGGQIIDANAIVQWDSGATEPNYASDIQIINDEIIYKTDFGKKLEKFFKDIMGLSK